MANNFMASLLFTLKEEGGFSDDPHDPGGATYKGITLSEFRIFRGDPNLTVDALLAITGEELGTIYMESYWRAVSADTLPDGVDLSVFDMGVNAGPTESIKLMQQALGLVDDGIIGPHTRGSIAAIDPATLIRRLYTKHNVYYRSLSNFHFFGHGWLNRSAARFNAGLSLIPNHMPQGKATR